MQKRGHPVLVAEESDDERDPDVLSGEDGEEFPSILFSEGIPKGRKLVRDLGDQCFGRSGIFCSSAGKVSVGKVPFKIGGGSKGADADSDGTILGSEGRNPEDGRFF